MFSPIEAITARFQAIERPRSLVKASIVQRSINTNSIYLERHWTHRIAAAEDKSIQKEVLTCLTESVFPSPRAPCRASNISEIEGRISEAFRKLLNFNKVASKYAFPMTRIRDGLDTLQGTQ